MGVMAPAYRRMLEALLPPGKLWRLIGAALLPKLMLGSADELDRLHDRAADLHEESDPRTAVELLPEYERELEFEAVGTQAERQARVVSRHIARQRYRPVDFQTGLAPLLGLAAASIVIIENTHAMAVALGDVREIFRFFVYRNPALGGTYYIDSAQELIDQIKPSHTAGHAIESINFLCDDEFSLVDRDLLGA